MATFEAQLQTILGDLVGGRCYPLVNIEGGSSKPYITFQVIAESDLTVTNDTKRRRRIQIDVFDDSYGGAKTIAASVESSLNSSIFAWALIMSRDLFEDKAKDYRQLIELYIWY